MSEKQWALYGVDGDLNWVAALWAAIITDDSTERRRLAKTLLKSQEDAAAYLDDQWGWVLSTVTAPYWENAEEDDDE
jgi:hypothetical protein